MLGSIIREEEPQKKKRTEEISRYVQTLKAIKDLGTKIPLGGLLGPIGKLLRLDKLKDGYDELIEKGHSPAASFVGSGAAVVTGTAAFLGGASLVGAGIGTAEIPFVGTTAATAGVLLMHKSREAARTAKHYVPIIVDHTLDKFSNLYASTTEFVREAYQQWTSHPEIKQQKFQDIESVMLALGYHDYAENIYSQLDQRQQLLYSTITRDLFAEQFKLNRDGSVNAKALPPSRTNAQSVDTDGLKDEIHRVQRILSRKVSNLEENKEGQLDRIISGQTKEIDQKLADLVHKANQRASGGSEIPQNTVQDAYQFCESLYATSQGVSLVARIAGNPRLANQVVQSAVAVNQIIMGVANIAQNGLSMGPVGMVLGGMNQLIACYGSENNGAAFDAIAEQLAMISKQIYALHEDMLLQFGKVFTALGIINTNIIEGFKLLHKDHENIFIKLQQLHKNMVVLQDSVNAVGQEVQEMRSELRGYVLEDDRKQFQLILNTTHEKIKRPFNRTKLQPEIIAAFKTYNVDLVARSINASAPTAKEIARNLSTQLGSAEANIGLLLNYAQQKLHLDIQQPIADPEQWRQCADILIQMMEKVNKEKNGRALLGKQDYKDFKYLKTIGDNWLHLINQFKTEGKQINPLARLFQQYRNQVRKFVSLLNQEMKEFVQAKLADSKFKHQGKEELKKQKAYKFEFDRNGAFTSTTNDWSGCKGFNNWQQHDCYVGEWNAHIAKREAEINSQLMGYKEEIKSAKHGCESITIPLFGPLPFIEHNVSASSFMKHETSTMPLLPLPKKIKIPTPFVEAERLGLGNIQHHYKITENRFIYTVSFRWHNRQLQPTLIAQFNKFCKFPAYLKPAERIWHAYMGGTYPANGSTTLEERGSYDNPNGDYHSRTYCNKPTISYFAGFRDGFVLSKDTIKAKISPENLEAARTQVHQALKNWRHEFNQKMLRQLESMDRRNPLAIALREVDASAKLLIAFISILFRETYQKPTAVWSSTEILDFVQHYQDQDVYLTHQLETNLEVVKLTENDLLTELNTQTEIAYTPINETLKKLASFMAIYEERVVGDTELARQNRAEQQQEAMLLGAMQAGYVIQEELISRGHNEAARDITRLFASLNLGTRALSDIGGDPATLGRVAAPSALLYSRPRNNNNPRRLKKDKERQEESEQTVPPQSNSQVLKVEM